MANSSSENTIPYKKATFCKGCWQNMHMPIPIRGALSIPFRLAGIKISRMNPNLCTICETQFTRVKHSKQITTDLTVLFADLRGYTGISQNSDSSEVSNMLNVFYDQCASAIWERDGIINKFMGDSVFAVFNFPIGQKDHVRQAVLAAIEIQKRCAEKKLQVKNLEGKDCEMGVGIGIHTGSTSVGEVGTAYKDFTVIGNVVNLASRMQGAAQIGEILVTDDVYRHVSDLFPDSQMRDYNVKGIDLPVQAHPIAKSPVLNS